jgi:2-methylcitrate dehydratase PrpD
MQTATQQIAAFVADLSYDELPPAVAETAKLHALDTLGCGLAAHALGEAPWVAAAAREVASCGPATGIGLPDGLPAGEAALVNGTLCHALDYDDTHPESVVHVSAAVMPAAFAAGEVHGAPGHDVVCALVAGNETSVRLGMAASGRFHARGFHPTSVCGVFGATAAAARLRGLDAERTTHALGIAASMASGLVEFLADGAKTKPLHPGWAAHAGLAAARLAAHGATGPATALEGRRGFFRAYLHGDAIDVKAQTADLGARWTTPDISYKPYPACHYTHAPLDALARLMAEGLEARDVESIVAISDQTGTDLVLAPLEDKHHPRTAYDAKFSLPYCLAALLVHGRVGVETFTDAAIAEPAVLDLAARVTAETRCYAPAHDAFPGGVRVRTHDGRTLEAELRYERGGPDNPMSQGEIMAKWRANAALALAPAELGDLEAALLTLEHQPDVTALTVLADAGHMRQMAAGDAGAEPVPAPDFESVDTR